MRSDLRGRPGARVTLSYGEGLRPLEQAQESDQRATETDRVYFHEGDIWWVRLGVNVGFEIDGKHRQFARPVIVLRKYNQYSFLALPLSTARVNRWRVAIGDVAGKEALAVLSQLR